MTARPPSDLVESPVHAGDRGTLLRLGWMLAGPALLAVLAILIWMGPSWTFTIKDALFGCTVGIVAALRYADVVHHHGATVDGEPATRRDLARYVVGLLIIGIVVWVGAQSFQLVAA